MSSWYPKASKVQNFSGRYPGSKMKPNVIVVHSTEGMTWPGYNSGATAPTFTVKPNFRQQTIEVRQHFPADTSARALENRPGGVQTNTLNAIQIELIGTCDPATHKRWGQAQHIYMPEAPDWYLKALTDLFNWIHDTYNAVPLKDAAPRGWKAYPSSYGNSKARLTGKEWENAYGILGHQHVPENSHGDPGNFPIGRLLHFLGQKPEPTTPKPNPTPPIVKKTKFGRHISINTQGNDGGTGTRTFKTRIKQIVKDVVAAKPSIVEFQEVRSGEQLAQLTDLMLAEGFMRSNRHNPSKLVTFVLKGVELVDRGQQTIFKNQNKGQKEGLLARSYKHNGLIVSAGNMHLDYRDDYDAGRVKQANEGFKSLGSIAKAIKADAQVMTGDMNSKSWVTDKAAKPNGFHDAFEDVNKNPNTRIDHTYLKGAEANKAFQRATKSDHKMQITDIYVIV